MAKDTPDKVLKAAMALFRKKGYQATTMRDVAEATGLSLGAAYYHYPSKQALVVAYFARTQDTIRARTTLALAGNQHGLGPRIRVVLHICLDAIAGERRFFGALFHSVADVDDPVSPFGAGTRDIRARSIANFADAIAPETATLPPVVAATLPTALWGLMMSVFLFYINDRSKKAERTRRLIDLASDLVADLARLSALPGLEPLLARVTELAAVVAPAARPPAVRRRSNAARREVES